VDEEKKTLDFMIFTLRPEQLAKRCKMLAIIVACELEAFANRRTSSAKKRCEIGG